MRRKRTTKERAESFLDMLAQQVVSGKVRILSCEAVAPCKHPVSESENVGGPDCQNLWKCKVCGKEWLR